MHICVNIIKKKKKKSKVTQTREARCLLARWLFISRSCHGKLTVTVARQCVNNMAEYVRWKLDLKKRETNITITRAYSRQCVNILSEMKFLFASLEYILYNSVSIILYPQVDHPMRLGIHGG